MRSSVIRMPSISVARSSTENITWQTSHMALLYVASTDSLPPDFLGEELGNQLLVVWLEHRRNGPIRRLGVEVVCVSVLYRVVSSTAVCLVTDHRAESPRAPSLPCSARAPEAVPSPRGPPCSLLAPHSQGLKASTSLSACSSPGPMNSVYAPSRCHG